jgi:diguanylate cyclase (GGDEF)-like protein/PAS domain S-box-containing protein
MRNASDHSGTVSIKRALMLGFAVVLALLAMLTFVGLGNMADIQSRLNRIVENHNVKIGLVQAMRNAARDRTISMYRMVTLSDPFERDAEFLQFNHYAAQFANARTAFVTMELDAREREILDAQGKITGYTVALQDEVVDLAIGERFAEAIELLFKKTIPAQDAVFVHLTELLDYQRDASARASIEANDRYSQARHLILGFGLAAIAVGIIIAFVAIRHSARNEHKLYREKERAQVTLHSIGDAVVTTDRNGTVEYLNKAAQDLTGWDPASARGQPLADVLSLFDENNVAVAANPAAKAIAGNRIVNSTGAHTLKSRDGSVYSIEYTAAPIHDYDRATLGAILVFRDITALREMTQQLAYQATHDALTGLTNRSEFERRVGAGLELARMEGMEHALLYLDLDQFKVVNDTCGHVAGDELLKQIATHLRSHVRKSDTLARLGGDEFGVLLDSCTAESAMRTAAELRDAIRDFRFSWDDKSFEVTTSIGVVPVRGDSGTLIDILSNADSACYVAKDLGRNRIHIYQPDDEELARRQGEMQWLPRIRAALKENRFCLYHQRIIPLGGSDGREHHEILLRMLDAENRIVPPGAFLPAAERYNLMPAIDRWVIAAAIRFLRDNREYTADANHIWTINLSGQTVCDDGLLEFVMLQIERAGVKPESICFEVTETTAVSNLTRASKLISTLKQFGCRFALDDFGAGLSSFGYLKNLPVDFLKIDGGFVRDMLTDPMDAAMVASINQIGHVMGLQTIAEFVENKEILEQLRKSGVDYAQGYAIHKPEPLTSWAKEPDMFGSLRQARQR